LNYQLDKRLENDSIFINRLELCEVRLLNDSRWPWLVLIPVADGLCEIFDLDMASQAVLAKETAFVSTILKNLTGAEKINTAALGNIVRQLHIHVIARNPGDQNWPGPVWGFGNSTPYGGDAAAALIFQLQSALDD